jgi:hypothetical protein
MDDLVRDFALSLTAEGKKPKTVKIYTDGWTDGMQPCKHRQDRTVDRAPTGGADELALPA